MYLKIKCRQSLKHKHLTRRYFNATRESNQWKWQRENLSILLWALSTSIKSRKYKENTKRQSNSCGKQPWKRNKSFFVLFYSPSKWCNYWKIVLKLINCHLMWEVFGCCSCASSHKTTESKREKCENEQIAERKKENHQQQQHTQSTYENERTIVNKWMSYTLTLLNQYKYARVYVLNSSQIVVLLYYITLRWSVLFVLSRTPHISVAMRYLWGFKSNSNSNNFFSSASSSYVFMQIHSLCHCEWSEETSNLSHIEGMKEKKLNSIIYLL